MQFQFNEHFSLHTQQAIQAYTLEQYSQTDSLEELGAAVQQKFQVVQRLSMRQQTADQVTVQCVSAVPLARLGDGLVIVDSGQVVDASVFTARTLRLLPHVRCAAYEKEGAQVPEFVLNTIYRLTPFVRMRYVCDIRSDRELLLHDVNDTHRVLVGDSEHLPDEQISGECDAILQELRQRQGGRVTQIGWKLDIRFAKQIIASRA